ncbi:MAG: PIN domain nuclease [Burkholderiales bacterium]|nr:PIN domain nuclease [Burkholderiales bacterium]
MILVDSSVWIDFFRGEKTPQTNKLDSLLGNEPLAMGDLILADVLQGFGTDREFNDAKRLLSALELVVLGGGDLAVEAAKNFRRLRAKGVTVRKTIDTIIATRCIASQLELLHSDRDFDAFEAHLGLRVVACDA